MSIYRYAPATIKLYDGFDYGFSHYTYHFSTPTGELPIQPVSGSRPLRDLASLIPSADFRQLLYEGHFQAVPGPFGAYTGTNKLVLSFWLQDRWLLVFASGESQPARYQIFLEGIWRLS